MSHGGMTDGQRLAMQEGHKAGPTWNAHFQRVTKRDQYAAGHTVGYNEGFAAGYAAAMETFKDELSSLS